MQSDICLGRLLLKAAFLFLLFNLLFAWFNPSPASLLLFRDHQRFPKLWEPASSIDAENPTGFRSTLVADLDILFDSHIVSVTPKSEDEYRVFLMGDSSVWGVSLFSNETMAAVLNNMGLYTCSGKKILVYNLGYEFSSVPKDVIILSEAVKYDPDLIVWFFSLVGFMPRRQAIGFVDENRQRLQPNRTLPDETLEAEWPAYSTETLFSRTLVGRRRQLRFIIKLNLSRLMIDMTDVRDPGISYPRPRASGHYSSDDPNLWGVSPPAPLRSYTNFGILDVIPAILQNREIVYINEPIGRGKDTGVRYNPYYPRWAYDQYRFAIGKIAADRNWDYVDLWDFLLPTEFSDTPFHRTPEGERRLAQKLAEIIVARSCSIP